MSDVSRRTTRARRASENKNQTAQQQQREEELASYEQYGSEEVRSPYLNMNLGRLVLGGQLPRIANRIGERVMLQPLQPLALILLSGDKIAPETHFGLLDAGKPRLTPEEVIERIVDKMHSPDLRPSMRLAESSSEAIAVSINGLFEIRSGHGFRAVAQVKDIPTNEYQSTGQLLGERTVLMRRFGEVATNPAATEEDPKLRIHFARGRSIDVPTFKAAAFIEVAHGDIEIELGPVGPIPTPEY